MFASLIIGTLNRAGYLSYCLESLRKQTYKDFEVIIIDQSSNEETQIMVESLKWNQIIYKKVGYKGLSKARNEAIRISNGDVYCLIDDDAYYESDYLANVIKHFKNDSHQIISGVLFNTKSNSDFVDYSKLKDGESLSYWQVTRYCPSPAVSFSKELINEIGMFDEEFGVGAKYGAGEETDLILRGKKKKFEVVHYKDIKARHPHEKVVEIEKEDKLKSYKYSYGIGAMYKKNTEGNLFCEIGMVYLERVLRDIIKAIINKDDWNLFKNLTKGFNDYTIKK